MVYSESAKLIGTDELKEIISEEYKNPTIERMMFIETKTTDKMPGKVFPCYMEAWAIEPGENNVEADELVFRACIVQCMDGGFNLLKVYLHDNELGVSKRIWDKPPTKGLRDETPWIATEVKQ